MKKLIKTVFVSALAVGLALYAFAGDDSVKVVGKGVGTDKTSALKDAYRNAVERAVGVFVDAEQLARDDKIITDQVLTQSNAYIRKFDIVDEQNEGGLIRIRILAEVAVGELRKSLSSRSLSGSQSIAEAGQTLHANMTTKDTRNADACALIGNFLKDYDPIRELMTISLARQQPVLSKPKNGKVDINFLVKIEMNVEKYNERMRKLHQLLEQISLEPQKTLRLRNDTAEAARQEELANELQNTYLSGDFDKCYERRYLDEMGAYLGISVLRGIVWRNEMHWSFSGKVSQGGDGCTSPQTLQEVRWLSDIEKAGRMDVIVLEKFNESRSSVVAKKYVVDKDVAKVIVDWQNAKIMHGGKSVHYDAILKDATGDEFAVQGLTVENKRLFNSAFMSLFDDHAWIVTPFVHGDAGSWQKWITFNLKVEDLKKLSSVTFELTE